MIYETRAKGYGPGFAVAMDKAGGDVVKAILAAQQKLVAGSKVNKLPSKYHVMLVFQNGVLQPKFPALSGSTTVAKKTKHVVLEAQPRKRPKKPQPILKAGKKKGKK